MIGRRSYQTVLDALRRQAAVALIGPRQVGKTTLAHELAEGSDALYLDLEAGADRDKLADPALLLNAYENRLVILDEIHRVPELFQELRGLIDQGRRVAGTLTSRYSLLIQCVSDESLKEIRANPPILSWWVGRIFTSGPI